MKIIGIYKITSPSNKIYIGQSKNIKSRIKNYEKLRCKSQTKLYNSLRKYRFENHTIEIIEQCSIEKLNDLEIYYISLYNCCSTGLNINPGGYLKSKETILKQQQTLKKRFDSGELTSKVKGTKNPKVSEMNKIRNAKYVGELNHNSVKCKCTSTNKYFHSLSHAWEELYKDKFKFSTFKNYFYGNRKNPTTIIRF